MMCKQCANRQQEKQTMDGSQDRALKLFEPGYVKRPKRNRLLLPRYIIQTLLQNIEPSD